jgi:transporter family protein
MWAVYAGVAAVAAGLTSIFMKVGLKDADSDACTFLRTVVVLFFAFAMIFIVGNNFSGITQITLVEWAYILGSGLATGISWITFYKALQLGDANKVAPVKRLSTVLTMCLAIIIFSESFWALTWVSMALMLAGTMLMIVKKDKPVLVTAQTDLPSAEQISEPSPKKSFKYLWLIYAVIALIAASFSTILARAGMQDVNVELATFFRTIIVLVMSFVILTAKGKTAKLKQINRRNVVFLCISGVLTGVSWWAFFTAIQLGYVSRVVPIDKLSIVVTVAFSYFWLKEKMTLKALIGLIILIVGTLLLLI